MSRPPSVHPASAPQRWPSRRLFAALVGAGVLPIFAGRYLPMVDLPQHLSLVHVLHQLGDPESRFGALFMPRAELTPYLGYYWTLHLLSFALPLELANRLVLAACVVGLVLGARSLARTLGRSEALSLFALPLAYSLDFYMGFLNFLAAQALMIGALAAYAARLSGRAQGRAWDAALVALPLACMATHVQPYLVFLPGLALAVLAFPGPRARTLALASPSAALFAAWLWRTFTTPAGGPPAVSDPLVRRLAMLPRYLSDQFQDRGGLVVLLALAALWLWGRFLSRTPPPAPSTRAAQRLPWALAAVALCAYLFMPTSVPARLLHWIHQRYAATACLFLALALPLSVAPRTWRRALAALCAANTLYLLVEFRRFDAEVGDLRALAEKVEQGSCVANLTGSNVQSSVMRSREAYAHMGAYFTLWRDAIPAFTFAETPHSPLQYRRKDGRPAAKNEEAAWPLLYGHHLAGGALFPRYAPFYRYFLFSRDRSAASVFGPYASQVSLVGESGPLVLYENPAGRCGR